MNERWLLFDSAGVVVAENLSLSLVPPTNGWSDVSLVLSRNTQYSLLKGTNAKLDINLISEGVTPSFENKVMSSVSEPPLNEVQIINLS